MSKPLEGAWFGRNPDHYATKGADVLHRDGGWYARCGKRIRGPLSSLDAAMNAADRMISEAKAVLLPISILIAAILAGML